MSDEDNAPQQSASADAATRAENLYSDGCGHSELQMWHEAACCLRRVPRRVPGDVYVRARSKLIYVELQRQAYARVVRIGLALAKRFELSNNTLTRIAVALHYAGRTLEAREFNVRHASQLCKPIDHCNAACFASVLGDFDNALTHLEQALISRDKQAWPEVLLDWDFSMLWKSWDVTPPSLAQAHRLVMPEFEQIAEHGASFRGEFGVGDQDLKHIPLQFHSLLDYPLGRTVLKLAPKRAAQHPSLAHAYLDWQQTQVNENVKRLRAARAAALEIVLAAQVGYAGEKAAAGCFTGARWHLMWALSERPAMLTEFTSEPRLQRWKEELLAPAAAAQAEVPDFFMQLTHVIDLAKHNSAQDALKIWRDVPGTLTKNPFHQFAHSLILAEHGDPARALPLCLEMCQAWREDASVFHNGAMCLMRLERWKEAVQLLDLASDEARAWPLLIARRKAAKAETRGYVAPKHRPFRGQPKMDGLWSLPSENDELPYDGPNA